MQKKFPCLRLWQLPAMWGMPRRLPLKDLIFFSAPNSLNASAAEAQLAKGMFSENSSEL